MNLRLIGDWRGVFWQTLLIKPAATVDELLAALDKKIDERGSPGRRAITAGTIILQPTDERRKTGSHYTPRSLTAPIVREALEPVLAQLSKDATPDQALKLKVCDPAMGSGAFLVETCRVLGERLEAAWARHPKLFRSRHDPTRRCLRVVKLRSAAFTELIRTTWPLTWQSCPFGL